jgi:hypothetical protein
MEWKKTLQDFEQSPPPQCWNEIREVLDQDLPLVRQKLSSLTAEPPPHSKHAIFQQISHPAQPRRIWLTRSKSIAAASIALVLGLSVLYIVFSPVQPPQVSVSVTGARKGDSITRIRQDENGYIWLYNINEEPIRISPKLIELIPALKDTQQSTIVKNWQQQLLESSFAPSGSNFMDIVELSRLLEEEKN